MSDITAADTESSKERAALIALVRWLGESATVVALPVHLHAQVREALGEDFYRDADREWL